MKDRIFGVLQRVGRSFMLPIAILPVAGLLLGIGGSFTNETTLKTYGLEGIMGQGTVFHGIFQVMNDAGNIVFSNLPILFAIGVAIGMAKKEKEVAALSAVIAFFIMHASISALISINGGIENMLQGAVADVCGITSLQMGVFGGIVVGLGVAALHNRFYRIELPQVLSFFGGTRFVPIISALVYTLVGILMYFIWPPVQIGINSVGNVVLNSGYIGTWVYGFMERLLIPFGLHHVFYIPFWQTAVGGTMEVGGRIVEGAQNIFFAQLADSGVTHFAVSATRFMSGKFPLMIFGLPGAALAMYRTAQPGKRKLVYGLLLSAALTSMVTGITEPLEFTFLFVAPLLYGIHCVFAGLAYALMHFFNVGVGMTFSGGLIDLFLFGILQGNAKTNWIWVVIVGVFYFIIYYFLFSFLIKKLNLRTPGRFDDDEVKLYKRSDVDAKKKGSSGTDLGDTAVSESDGVAGSKSGGTAGSDEGDGSKEAIANELSIAICKGLGGKDNISDVDCCATRLRCTVFNADLVNDSVLRMTGASGVVHKGNGVQIIYGPKVTVIKSDFEEFLESDLADTIGKETEALRENYKDSIRENNENGTMESNENNGNGITRKETSITSGGKKILVLSPITGFADKIENAPDEAFASKMMGDGAVVTPRAPIVKAPVDGEVTFVFDSKHAIGIKDSNGLNYIIHVGIDTVKLGGKGFDVFVRAGDKVKYGDTLMKFDLEYLKKNAPSIVSPVLCTDMNNRMTIKLLKEGAVQAGEELFEIEISE
ncbi:glucose PTS transporter subunit IIA [Eubacterium sp.]|uniref:PTS transporter subunit IIABC n=1 Tax=Eubacterium sp. TaxID=142586 RepID=UPI00352241E7